MTVCPNSMDVTYRRDGSLDGMRSGILFLVVAKLWTSGDELAQGETYV